METESSITIEHVIFASYGNDSIALIQWASERNLPGVVVAHSDTGWAAPDWAERVERASAWAQSLGFVTVTIPSIGMRELVRSKKGWPLPRKFQFCTEELKIRPAQRWLAEVDPDCEAVCLVGVRREESKERAQWPEWVEESDKHGGRSLWSPLVNMAERERERRTGPARRVRRSAAPKQGVLSVHQREPRRPATTDGGTRG